MSLDDSLVAYFNLDESNNGDAAAIAFHKGSGGDMRDVYSNVGAEPTGQPNNAGRRALLGAGAGREYFDTINDAADYYDTSTGPFSLACWFTCEDFAQNRYLITRWDSSIAADQEWLLAINGAQQKVFMGLRSDATTVAYHKASDVTIASGVLHFVCAGYDPDSDVMWLSFNGESKITGPGPGGHVCVQKINLFTIGADYAGFNSLTAHNGRMARVGFWEKVLSDTDNTQLYNSGAGKKYPWAVASGATPQEDGSLGPGGRSRVFFPPFNPLP
jgi:hypothetical protein